MKNTIESDAKSSALEIGAFVPSRDEMLESLSLEQLVEAFGGYMVAPKRMDYVIVREGSNSVSMTANFSQECCFFYHTKMFQNHKWLERHAEQGHECVRADVWTARQTRKPYETGNGEMGPRNVGRDLWELMT